MHCVSLKINNVEYSHERLYLLTIPHGFTASLKYNWELSSYQRDSDASIGGIRKVSHTPRLQNFRSRLQRALSLSSSESEDTGSLSRSATGDTTEDYSSLQEENDSGD
ncbi:unnamed protein product [Penicillium camemberti]|uniref:Str. FM013 n=1 Tax=Penicillium camemberti (strain FM 013) TaxID=1429867 RepID=A0A0G4PUM8_PENC3|nr:unnamed protein product [Penicillium camemberti]